MAINFSPFPKLVTSRLLLKRLSLEDAEEIFTLRTDEVVNKYLARPKATSIEEAKAFIEKINLAIDSDQSVFWAISLKEDPKLIGTVCLWNFSEEENKAEIGYELLPQFHGKGIMQEAFLKVVEFGFKSLQLHLIEAWTVKQNQGSIKILERNHFVRDYHLENKIDRTLEGPDLIIYSLSKTNYLDGWT